MTKTPSTTQDRDEALIEQVIDTFTRDVMTQDISDDTSGTVRSHLQVIAEDIIETVREYDFDASAPWPLPQEMP